MQQKYRKKCTFLLTSTTEASQIKGATVKNQFICHVLQNRSCARLAKRLGSTAAMKREFVKVRPASDYQFDLK